MTDYAAATNNGLQQQQQQQQQPPQTIDGGASRPPAPSRGGSSGQLRNSQSHKRSNSEDLTQSFQRQHQMMMMQGGGSSGSLGSTGGNFGYGNMYAGSGGGVVPPPPPPHGYYYAYGAPMGAYSHPIMSQSQQLPDYTHQQQQQQQQQQQVPGTIPANNNRARSWSGDAFMFDRQQQVDWMATMQPQQQQQQQQQQMRTPFNSVRSIPYGATQQPTTPRSSRHRRSNSSSSAGGSGAGGSGTPTNSGQFSPRTEFMKLANVGTPNSPRAGGGSPRGQYAPYTAGAGMAAYSPHLQAPMSMPPPPQAYETVYDSFESSGGGGGGASPYMSPEKKLLYGSNSMATSSLGSAGGEAVYLAQQARRIAAGSGSAAHPSSTRKRHMRQQSVQLFMQEIKGVEQPPACRDVVFLLLFVFHLFGMVLLSNMYSYEALDGDTHETTEITVNYNNLLLIACCCGGFAIAVSTILLAVMSYFARNFVQVALVVAIAMSFVWGTLGIGLSPQNLVPVTGIVALALTVAYAIVVWDRLPFSTANLRTALLAVGSYPGTIVMTLVSQVLGLGWSIYYAVICCGIYDAIQDGRIVASYRFQTAIYVLLGISYYWTIQVLLVSRRKCVRCCM